MLIVVEIDDDASHTYQSLFVEIVNFGLGDIMEGLRPIDWAVGEGEIDSSHHIQLPASSEVVEEGDFSIDGRRLLDLLLNQEQVPGVLVLLGVKRPSVVIPLQNP